MQAPDPNAIAETQGSEMATSAAVWLSNVCCSGAAWDYKTQGPQYDAFGNFNYGATGAAVGLSDEVLLAGADLAKYVKTGHQNELDKQITILQGTMYFRNGCGNF
jgi:Bacterial toxin 44